MTDPLLSVIIPSYNHGRYVRQTIDSCLAQSYRPLEIIVVDGASGDETLDILRGYHDIPEVQWSSERDSGPVEAVNKGLVRATGRVALIQSSDDLSAPGSFALVMEMFKADPSLGLVYGNYDLVDEAGCLTNHVQVGPYSLGRLLSRRTFVPQPCAFFDLAQAKKLGGWDERFPYTPDTELWFKIALTSKVIKREETLGLLRQHDQRRDHQTKKILASYTRMINESKYIAGASRADRRAAKVGAIQLRQRYGDKSSWSQFYWTWRLFVADPTYITEGSFPGHRLVPFYFPIAGLVGRARRFMKRSASFFSDKNTDGIN